MKNLNKAVGADVMATHGTNSMGGIFITETLYSGVITKINAKSVKTVLTYVEVVRIGKSREILAARQINQTANFTFWKNANGRELYKNREYGILEF